MLSVYKLTNAINESASGIMSIDSIAPYQFIGGLDEATSEMNYILMAEATDIASLHTGAVEIMTEAAITNPGSLNILSENVFQTIGTRMRAFIDKVIAMVKGMIEKIKAFFYRLTGKIDKWLNIMRPRITEARKYGGASDQEIEMHKWDVAYITAGGGMITGVSAVASDMTKSVDDTFSKVNEYKSKIRASKTVRMNDNMRDKGADNEDVKDTIELVDRAVEQAKKETEKMLDELTGKIATKLAVTGDNPGNMDEIWTAVTKKATGGEKVTMKFSEAADGDGVDGMLKAIEGSKKSISGLEDAYKKHLSELSKLKNAINNTFKNEPKLENSKEFAPELVGKYEAYIAELSTRATKEISIVDSALNVAKSKHIDFIQQMTSEYMKALSKFANYKGKKKDEA